MYRRRIIVTLPAPDYRRLAELAAREERATDQQASFLLKRVLNNGMASEVAGAEVAHAK